MKPSRTAARVLVADDDPGVIKLIPAVLRLAGYTPVTCGDGETALRLFEEADPRLVIVDVRMPQLDGISVCRRIRGVSDVPVMMLTGIDDQKDAADALEAGADDWVRKPFGVDELMARVKALLRRSQLSQTSTGECITYGPLVVDGAQHLASIGATPLNLTPTELALIYELARHGARVLTHRYLLDTVWGAEYADAPHILHVTMSRLRAKLRSASGDLIETVPRVGYRMGEPAVPPRTTPGVPALRRLVELELRPGPPAALQPSGGMP
ncbi:MAG: response regulator transcription factor [Dehalococcoidia bacterium]